MKLFALSALALMAWGSASVRAAPWIQQNRWMVLGPLDNPAWCWGDLPNPPAPGHDLALECPRLGDDWSGGAIPFVTGALTRWTDLDALGVGRGDVVDLESLAVNLGLPDELRDGVKALLAIYVINRTASPLEVGVCTASDDAIKVWVNDRTVVGLPACRGVTCTCSEVNPAVLIPGKNKVLVAQYEGEGGWGFRLRLLRADGTVIDDTTDPEVQFTLDPPEDCPRLGSSTVLRSVGGPVSACEAGPDARSLITLRGSGGGNPDDQVAVTEHLDGQAAPSEISDGGVYTPQVPPLPCGTAPLGPVGIFRDHRDIGRPCAAGSTATGAPGAYTVTGGGCDIWANCDQFQYAYTHLRGDFSIRARIAKRPWDEPGGLSPNRWGKFGLMVRQDCSDESRCAFIHDSSPTPDGGDLDQVRFLGRPTQGGDDVFDTGLGPAGLHPSHLRLDRVGSRFIGYASPDGAAWTELHSMDWGPSAPCEVLVGLAVTSHSCCETLPIDFDQVEVTGGEEACPPAPPSGGTIAFRVKRSDLARGLSYQLGGQGAVRLLGGDGEHAVEGRSVIDFNAARPEPVGPHFENAQDIYPFFLNRGSTSFDPQSGLYTVESSGLDIWDGGDSFHFAYRRVAGDFDFTVLITERIDPPVPDSRWGKHGLMARKDCSQLSKYSLVRTTSGAVHDWPVYGFREVHGVDTFSFEEPAFDYGPDQWPRFMRLVRLRRTFYGFLSRDGNDWRPLGSDTWGEIDLLDPILVGFAASSHWTAGPNPTTIRFKVLRLEPPSLPLPIPDDGTLERTVVYSTDFEDPARFGEEFQVQHRVAFDDQGNPVGSSFNPQIVSGRLRMQEEHEFYLASSTFRRVPLEDVDSAIYQFDFDAISSREPGGIPAGGLTFTLLGGRDPGRVGLMGSNMGYGGNGIDTRPESSDRNISRNSFAVELDSWAGHQVEAATNEGLGGPSAPRKYHLGIDAGNSIISVAQTSENLPDIFDPAGIHARVLYNRGRVEVSLGSNAGGGGELKKVLEAQVLPISFAAPDESAVFGFTAGTGGAAQTGEVDNLRVTRIAPRPGTGRVRCDCNGDERRDLSDPVSALQHLFLGGTVPCPAACDCNGDAQLDISDAVFDLQFQFLAGPRPPEPYPACESFAGCAAAPGCP